MTIQRIVVGVDGSPASCEALEWAVAEALLRGATITVVHAWHVGTAGLTPFGGLPDVDPTVYEEAARATLQGVLDSVDTASVTIETSLPCTGAAGALLEHAADADLLVLGARGHGGFTGLLLGSVTNQVAHHSPCPVVIVPARAAGR